MASKNVKSSNARITEERREGRAAQAKKPWRKVSIEFFLGAMVMAAAFILTPLGPWCVTHYEPMVISVAKCDHKPQAAAKNKGSQQPDPDAMLKLAQARAAQGQDGRNRKTEKAKDPLAELRRIEEINARNRRMMTQRTVRRGYASPQPTVPQPYSPAIPQPHQPAIPRPAVPAHTGYVRP